ncbi:uncharacterized protein LOC141970145 isoform X2 [Athene noctua]|uniref:uncharacterized protein LOC141970145 isoform X2 n=1 Tax=Athene noctua TaxID=126797 RepID=UPI003EB713B8
MPGPSFPAARSHACVIRSAIVSQTLKPVMLAPTSSPTSLVELQPHPPLSSQIYVKQQDCTGGLAGDLRVAKMSLIDLAGSERASVANTKGERLREGANINRSLLALINVINALAEAKSRKSHIPYRDSKLTRLLKDSIGGHCRTIMIAAVSPSVLAYEDTYNTLKYAGRAKEIKVSVSVAVPSTPGMSGTVQRLQDLAAPCSPTSVAPGPIKRRGTTTSHMSPVSSAAQNRRTLPAVPVHNLNETFEVSNSSGSPSVAEAAASSLPEFSIWESVQSHLNKQDGPVVPQACAPVSAALRTDGGFEILHILCVVQGPEHRSDPRGCPPAQQDFSWES